MSEKTNDEKQKLREKQRIAQHKMPVWKTMLLSLSVILMIGGGGVRGYSYLTSDPPPETVRKEVPNDEPGNKGLALFPGEEPRSFAETDTPPDESPVEVESEVVSNPMDDWSGAVFKLGFSFFAGFCIAYALKMFMKITLIFVGVVLIAVIVLQSSGAIDVDWSAIAGHFDSITEWIRANLGGIKEFLTGQLPSAGSAFAGMFVGFRK